MLENDDNRKKIFQGKEYISMLEASKFCSYSQEYLSLLARRGRIEAKKIGRNWYVTHEALKEYVQTQGIAMLMPRNIFAKQADPMVLDTVGIEQSMPPSLLISEESEPEPVHHSTTYEEFLRLNSNILDTVGPPPEPLISKDFPSAEDPLGAVPVSLQTAELSGTSLALLRKMFLRMIMASFLFVGIFGFSNTNPLVRDVITNTDLPGGYLPGIHANQGMLLDGHGNADGIGGVRPEYQSNSEIQASGTHNLSSGEAKVFFDASFATLVSDTAPIRVFVTPVTADIQGQLYVSTKTPFGFIVKELDGSSNGTFDWLVIAYRKDLSGP